MFSALLRQLYVRNTHYLISLMLLDEPNNKLHQVRKHQGNIPIAQLKQIFITKFQRFRRISP